jgi:hypothetical protein
VALTRRPLPANRPLLIEQVFHRDERGFFLSSAVIPVNNGELHLAEVLA